MTRSSGPVWKMSLLSEEPLYSVFFCKLSSDAVFGSVTQLVQIPEEIQSYWTTPPCISQQVSLVSCVLKQTENYYGNLPNATFYSYLWSFYLFDLQKTDITSSIRFFFFPSMIISVGWRTNSKCISSKKAWLQK